MAEGPNPQRPVTLAKREELDQGMRETMAFWCRTASYGQLTSMLCLIEEEYRSRGRRFRWILCESVHVAPRPDPAGGGEVKP